jgi:lipopolysaccharide transport system ATP-binding protein
MMTTPLSDRLTHPDQQNHHLLSQNQDNIIASVRQLGKMYLLYNKQMDRLKHILFGRLRKSYGKPFWALKDISFEIKKGETFGIIGRNGSGKSTLLQIMAGILQPTTGKVSINGRVAALLELGSGFNPEFTGRENVILNGMILGLTRAEIEAKFQDIAEFADIGDFIDQPVKIYSSGMFVRLAFAVAAGIDADLVLIDEALAVGDIFFRQKCYRRLQELREKGSSIVLVSHAMNEVEQFCEHALLLHDSQMVYLGTAVEAVKRFYFVQQTGSNYSKVLAKNDIKRTETKYQENGGMDWPIPEAFIDLSNFPQVSNQQASCTAAAICSQDGESSLVFQQGEVASFFYEFIVNEEIEVPIGGVEIINDKGVIVHGKNSLLYGSQAPAYVAKGGRVRFRQDIKLDIAAGEYTFNIGFSTISQQDYAARKDLPHPELDAKIKILSIVLRAGKFAVVYRLNGEPVQLTHFGTANLQGQCQVTVI